MGIVTVWERASERATREDWCIVRVPLWNDWWKTLIRPVRWKLCHIAGSSPGGRQTGYGMQFGGMQQDDDNNNIITDKLIACFSWHLARLLKLEIRRAGKMACGWWWWRISVRLFDCSSYILTLVVSSECMGMEVVCELRPVTQNDNQAQRPAYCRLLESEMQPHCAVCRSTAASSAQGMSINYAMLQKFPICFKWIRIPLLR